MDRLILVLLLLAGGWFLVNRLDPGVDFSPSRIAVRRDGPAVVVESDEIEARFLRLGRVSDSFMLFGGNNQQLRNQLQHVVLAALAIGDARAIHQRYPDFHLCKSPGAAQAQRLVEDMSIVAASRSARRKLIEVVDLHAKRVRGNGERTCLGINGTRLVLDSVRVKPVGEDITHDVAPMLERQNFVLAEQVEIPDCETLLR